MDELTWSVRVKRVLYIKGIGRKGRALMLFLNKKATK